MSRLFNSLRDGIGFDIVLVGAAGLSYEEAAGIAGCALGTIKSRVNRARNRLAEVLDMPRGGTG